MGGESTCSGADLCVTKYVWKRISDSINDAVDDIKLSELVDESLQLRNEHGSKTNLKIETLCDK